MWFITIPVILYQLFFITVLVIGGLVGRKTLFTLATLALLWTATHVFFWPLAVFQTLVIVSTTSVMWLSLRWREKTKRPIQGRAERIEPVWEARLISQDRPGSEDGGSGSQPNPQAPAGPGHRPQ